MTVDRVYVDVSLYTGPSPSTSYGSSTSHGLRTEMRFSSSTSGSASL